ncbi:MAG: DUF3108 domain-containing protein, partial [Aquificae bacterium]|nr:DUF3108 domain-containing protein [Aquificota bacterium]
MNFIIIFIFFLSLSFKKTLASEEKICYLVEYFFIDVAKVCITYIKNEKIETKVEANTLGFVNILKNISYFGFSKAKPNFKPEEFYFNQKEKGLRIVHHYEFKENYVKIQKIINEKKFLYYVKIKEKFYLEPFSASLYLFDKVKEKEKKGFLTIFYNGKIYKVPYEVLEKKDFLKIKIKPKIEVEGIIKPKGDWYLYIKKDGYYPEYMELKIRIGKIRLRRIRE